MMKFINKFIRSEECASKHINILNHYDDDTLLDKNDRLIKIIKLDGIDFVTKDEQTLDIYKNRRNSLLKSFSSSFALYFWEVRKKTVQFPGGVFEDGYAKTIDEKYRNYIQQTEMFHKEHYLAIITKQPEGFLNKPFNLIEKLKFKVDRDQKRKYLAARHKELNDVTNKVISALSDYKCKLLSVYEKNDIKFSSSLEFLGELLNSDSHTVPLEIKDAATLLTRKRLFFNNKSGTLELRSANGKKKFAAVLAIKGYQPFTYQGILNDFGLLNIEYVITQSFRPFDSQVAKNKMRDQQKDMFQSKDESITQAEQIDEAFDDAASGEVGYGQHHLTMTCYADTQEDLNRHVATITSKFSDLDIACVREDIAAECGFWGQFPANFSYLLRPAVISTKNMAAFASFHNYSMGQLKGNHWADAVTVFETLSGSPYYFNFHYKDVGNFQVFGAMGSGKTLLVGFLIAQSMKFGGKRIIFDKDRGLEVAVRAFGGVYETLKPGKATGFNPCQLDDDTPENRKFLSDLFKKILTVNNEVLSAHDYEVIEGAIDGMYRLEKSSRQFCHIASFFGTKKSGNLRARFDQWHSDGSHAWLFDNVEDKLNLKPNVLGFDLGHILADKDCKTPALMYLLHRVEQALEGERGILFCDEGWLMLTDEYFKKIIENWSRTQRKLNNIFGLATQVANDTVNSAISKAINESSFCKMFFPNPMADRKVHVEDLGLTEYEYQLLKKLPDDQHYFLLVHGRGVNKQSVVVRVNLSKLQEVIAIISAREESLAVLDQVIAEVGDDPNIWIPVFLSRIKQGNSQ